MNNLRDVAATRYGLTVTASEEASRLGDHQVRVDHLFLALVVNEQEAGKALRSLNITLESARAAVAAQHAEQLASLGVRADGAAPGQITYYEGADYAFDESARRVLVEANEASNRGDAAAVLRAILAEPSGFIEAVLNRLDATPDVLARLNDITVDAPAGYRHHSESLAGSVERFVPAGLPQVWAMLADPARMAEWEPGTGAVEGAPGQVVVGSWWLAHAKLKRPDGKRLRVKHGFQTARVEVTSYEPNRYIEWCFSWPETRSNMRIVGIGLDPVKGGTQLSLSSAWVASPAAGRPSLPVLRRLLRPVHSYAIWIQLMQLGGAISRAFR